MELKTTIGTEKVMDIYGVARDGKSLLLETPPKSNLQPPKIPTSNQNLNEGYEKNQ